MQQNQKNLVKNKYQPKIEVISQKELNSTQIEKPKQIGEMHNSNN